ncbi:ribonuclease H-like domain-containing protein [Tanacetum coccineum]
MSVHGYTDDEYELADPVTLISSLDVSNHLHLHLNDSAALTVISMKLKGTKNYQVWSCAMLLALEEKNKIGFIDVTCRRSIVDEVLGRQWDRVNAVVLGSILSREPLPDVRNSCAIISSEESHRVVSSSGFGTSQRSQSFVFNSSVGNRNNTQRPQTSGNFSRPSNVTRSSNSGNRRANGGSVLGVQKFNKRFINNNNSVGCSTSSIALIKENTISSNGKVVPEYYVNLMSVYKVARDNKLIVSFDESKCYVLPRDLREMKVLGIVNKKDGLYYFNEKQVLDPPNDEMREDDSPNSEGNNSFQYGSPTIDQNENEVVHSIGSSGSTTEVQTNQLVRRSEMTSVFANKYNKFVVDCRVKYGLEKYVNCSKLSYENKCFITELNKNLEPKTYWQACKDQHWIKAINNEMDALYRNDTWELTELHKDRKAIGSKWVFKIKYKSNREIERYKARLVSKRFNQKEGIDFDETFSHIVKIVTSNPGKGIHIVIQPNTSLEDFMDVDWAKCLVTRKSVTAEAEYRAVASVTLEIVWILEILKDLEWEHFLPVKLYYDSQAAINLS